MTDSVFGSARSVYLGPLPVVEHVSQFLEAHESQVLRSGRNAEAAGGALTWRPISQLA